MAAKSVDVLVGDVLRWSDRAEVKTFSPAEMLDLTELGVETVHAWYKRGQLPTKLFEDSPGRGNRRRYDSAQIVFLTTAKALIDSGVSVKATMALRLDIRIFGLLHSVLDLSPKAAVEKLRDEPHPLVALIRVPEGYTSEPLVTVAHGFAAVDILARDTQQEMLEWMRGMRAVSFTVLDTVSLTVKLLANANKLSRMAEAA